jgi:hypothetical protein
MTIKHLFPTAKPALNLDFANTKQLDPRITFTRTSTATYFDSQGVLQTAASGEPRFDHDPATGENLGLLIEETRTNNCLYSEHLNQTGWSTNNGTVSLSAFAAPDSTVSMYGFTATSADADIRYSIATSIIGEVTFSFFLSTQTTVRYVAAYNHRYNAQSAVAVFDLQEETATADYDSGTTTGSTVATIRRLGNNFYRCSLTYEQVNASSPIFGIGPTTQTSLIASYLGDPRTSNGGLGDLTGESVYVWGAQIEYNASFPTSYIPTLPTFTSRNSTATYSDANGVIQTAAIDVARDDAYLPDENGVLRPVGLLLEESRTNLQTYSEDMTNSVWIPQTGATVTPNAIAAPDGNLTAEKLTEGTALQDHYLYSSHGTSLQGTKTFSIWVKKAEREYAVVGTWDRSNVFARFSVNLNTGEVVEQAAENAVIDSVSVISYPNGWYKCSITSDSSVYDSSAYVGVAPSPDGDFYQSTAPVGYTGDGTSGIYIWGAQLEAGSFSTSYIPTTTTTVTRAADISSSATVTRATDLASILGSAYTSIFGTPLGSGSIFANVLVLGEKDNTNGSSFAGFGTNNNSIFTSFFVYDNRLTVGFLRPSLANVAKYDDLTGQRVKGAISWTDLEEDPLDQANASNALDGDLYGGNHYNIAGTPLNKDYDRFGIGRAIRSVSTFSSINGHIARLAYYPVRLSDEQLQALTS